MAAELADCYGDTFGEFLKHFSEANEHPLALIRDKICPTLQNKDISLLSVGPGDGSFERFLTGQCFKETMIGVKQLDLYEPDEIFFNKLKDAKWSDSVKNVQVLNEAVQGNTEFSRRYDLILLRHVCYFFKTEENSRVIFERLVQSLAPGGSICIINCAWNLGHRISDQIRLVSAFPHLTDVKVESETMQAETLHWAFCPVIQKHGLECSLHKKETYISLGRLDSAFPSVLTTLSVLIGHKDLNEESDEQKSKLKKWIIENYFKDQTRQDEEVTFMDPQAVLIYTLPNKV